MNFEEYLDKKFLYDIYVTSVYDGDTITCDINVGFGIMLKKQKIRLFGIDTPEVRGDEKEFGQQVRDELRTKILNKNIQLYSIKDKTGKYGRYLGIIYLDEENINQWLLDKGYAKVLLY